MCASGQLYSLCVSLSPQTHTMNQQGEKRVCGQVYGGNVNSPLFFKAVFHCCKMLPSMIDALIFSILDKAGSSLSLADVIVFILASPSTRSTQSKAEHFTLSFHHCV